MDAEDWQDRPFSIQTSGNFLCTKIRAPVRIQFVCVKFPRMSYAGEPPRPIPDLARYINEGDPDYYFCVEIGCVYEVEDWDVDKDNLIYGDPGFLQGMRKMFALSGFQYSRQLEYSDRMMQGRDYVSLRPAASELAKEIWNSRDRHVVEDGEDAEGGPQTILFVYFDAVPQETVIVPATPDEL
jgi:hypothetical protein